MYVKNAENDKNVTCSWVPGCFYFVLYDRGWKKGVFKVTEE